MLAYAAHRPSAGKRQSSPNALLVVISAHVALLAIVMSAKMDLPSRIHDPVTTIQLLPRTDPPPPANPARIRPRTELPPARTSIANPKPVIATPILGEAAPERDDADRLWQASWRQRRRLRFDRGARPSQFGTRLAS